MTGILKYADNFKLQSVAPYIIIFLILIIWSENTKYRHQNSNKLNVLTSVTTIIPF